MTKQKTCSTCKRTLAVSNFNKQRKHKDGLTYNCKVCLAECGRKRRLKKKAELSKMKFEGDRVCPNCDRTLHVSHFYKSTQTKDRLERHCKDCQRAYVVDWQRRNKEKFNSYQREWRSQNKEKHAASAKYSKIRNKYGLSREEYDSLMEQSHCGICDADLTERKPALDHCHATGKIRGVLCSQCNTGLGMFHNNPEALRRAAEYLS
jgi:hypothetical protein